MGYTFSSVSWHCFTFLSLKGNEVNIFPHLFSIWIIFPTIVLLAMIHVTFAKLQVKTGFRDTINIISLYLLSYFLFFIYCCIQGFKMLDTFFFLNCFVDCAQKSKYNRKIFLTGQYLNFEKWNSKVDKVEQWKTRCVFCFVLILHPHLKNYDPLSLFMWNFFFTDLIEN